MSERAVDMREGEIRLACKVIAVVVGEDHIARFGGAGRHVMEVGSKKRTRAVNVETLNACAFMWSAGKVCVKGAGSSDAANRTWRRQQM